jgi:hypothetical protein
MKALRPILAAAILAVALAGLFSIPRGQEADRAADGTSPGTMFVSIPPPFKTLERAPVLFPHDRHTRELAGEGCGACHPRRDGAFAFSFPVRRDESGPRALMDSIHDACISCHEKRSAAGKTGGPVTCGECHSERKAYHAREYLPPLPRDFDALRDPYHRQCIECHRKPGAPAEAARDLDWKKFTVREKRRIEIETPKMVFDYRIHHAHLKALENRCDLCHTLEPALKAKLAAEGREPTGQDWLRKVPEGKSWDVRESAHDRCLNCHLQRREAKLGAGPVECGACHSDRPRPLEELAGIPPPDYGDRQKILIRHEKATLHGVPFDHKAHIAASRSCGDCHHKSLDSCATCHAPAGAKEGGFVALADAYHREDSPRSCAGCHAREQRKPDCAGCHHLRREGLAGKSCEGCHTGKLETLGRAGELPAPSTLFPEGMEDELKISILEKEYGPCAVQHRKIAEKLTEISNRSRLASAFHRKETTVCAGCHHVGPVEAGQPVPPCAACHAASARPEGRVPTLLGAYHQACLGCHVKMGYPEKEMPRQCSGCHPEKAEK